MKRSRSMELNIDFIGGEGPFTKEEEAAISAFIKAEQKKRDSTQISDEEVQVLNKEREQHLNEQTKSYTRHEADEIIRRRLDL